MYFVMNARSCDSEMRMRMQSVLEVKARAVVGDRGGVAAKGRPLEPHQARRGLLNLPLVIVRYSISCKVCGGGEGEGK